MSKRTRENGFTLIELMIVVAIIGVLTSIAIPNFQSYQLRSRRAEGYANLPAIARLENAYFGEHGIYLTTAAPQPGGGLGPAKRDFTPAAEAVFAPVGWVPEGDVYFDYHVSQCACADCFTASAYGDTDADGNVAVIMYVHASPTLGVACPDGVFGFVTPIDPQSGNPVFDAVAVNGAADDF